MELEGISTEDLDTKTFVYLIAKYYEMLAFSPPPFFFRLVK
jgi:hypothetical protein